jgi:hypothetical protein
VSVARRLLLLADLVLVGLAIFLGVRLYQAWTARPPTAPPEPTAAVTAEAPAPAAPEAAPAPLSAYAVVAERNLFSPTRTEVVAEPPRTAAGTPPAPPAPKPRLYGVVQLPDGRSRAYLEDVQRRRVFAYSVGDTVGDARVEQIRSDRVILRRGTETFEVLLHDPTKPRPSAPPSAVQSPEAGGPARPEVRRPPGPVPPQSQVPRGIVRPRPGVPSSEAPRPEPQEPSTPNTEGE